MGWIDVAIPGGIGILLLVAPGLFVKPSGDAEKDARKAATQRGIGILLLGVAVMYMFVKMASGR
jgi:hypothetical protein